MYKRLIITFSICLFFALALGIIANIALFKHYHIQPGTPRALAILPLLVLLTFIGLLFRFWRWHYFLRQSDIRIPTRISLSIYLSGFSQTIIPLFVGEIALKSILVKRHSNTPLERTVLIVTYERLLDFLALAILTIPYIITHQNNQPIWTVIPIGILVLLLIPPLRTHTWKGISLVLTYFIRLLLPQYKTTTLRTPASIISTRVTVIALILSLASWLTVASILPLASSMLNNKTPWLEGTGIYAISTIIGGSSLSPGGVGITGSAIAESLIQRGMETSSAGLAAVLTRLSTFALVFALGLISFLAYLWWSRKSKSHIPADQFFGYESEFAVSSRDYYIRKKLDRMTPHFKELSPAPNSRPTLGLDLGCGPGWHLSSLSDSGLSIFGIDTSTRQLQSARKNAPTSQLLTADIQHLPYKHRQFDFAYCINIIHHLPTKPSQKLALCEIHRILKPGGVLFLHEMNPTNTLFRFYLEYILPLFNPVDRGTEFWITPKSLKHAPIFNLTAIDYFTFLPDFLPKWVLLALNPLERLLEQSPLNHLSYHYMAILQKPYFDNPH